MLRWALPALVSHSLRWPAVVSHQRQMVLRPLQDQGDVAGIQNLVQACVIFTVFMLQKTAVLQPQPVASAPRYAERCQHAFFLPSCPCPTILKSCRPSRALALPPRVSALYSQDFSKAVRAINSHSPVCTSCRLTPYSGEAQSIKPAEGAVEGCFQSFFGLELGRMVPSHAALCLHYRAFCC